MKDLKLFLIEPRGFCAGVQRAIDIVNKSLSLYDTPIYIRNEIVHNKIVVNEFKKRGVTFVKEVHDIPDKANAIFSAHGISTLVENQAQEKQLNYIDATCPLVKNVHKEGIKYHSQGYHIILIGHKGHPEIEGTFGRIPSNVYIVSDTIEAENIYFDKNQPLAYITQTTLSLDDTKDIIDILQKRFPHIVGPTKNICYATQNRQNAVKAVINKVDALIVIGSQNSSNSNRLKEIGDKNNKLSFLIDTIDEIPFTVLDNINTLGLSAGASAPNEAMNAVINEIKKHYNVELISCEYIKEDVVFHLPKQLR